MQEDCLITNIYVPNTNETKLPVAVSIHGGAFQIGYGDMLPTDKFTKNTNVITVTFNYRLGAYGFLCLGTESAPGNAGLKDQVSLLKWVKENIESFGGNPNDITLMGCSAGGVSVELLMLSKSTDGLFNKVIPESGSSIGFISIQQNPIETAIFNAKSLNFTNVDDLQALEEFYKSVPIELLVFDDFWDSSNFAYSFIPCIEDPTSTDAIITDVPANIIMSGDYKKLPMLYGLTNMEGLNRFQYFELWKTRMNEDFSEFLPIDLHFNNEEDKLNVIKSIKEFYFGDQQLDEKDLLGFIDYYTDTVFGHVMLKATRLHVNAGHDKIYLYEYSYVDNQTPPLPNSEARGATHCSQTLAVWGVKMFSNPGDNPLGDHDPFHSTVRQLWSNFIKTGQPVPEGSPVPNWPPVGHNISPHMSIGEKIELKRGLLENRSRFWDEIYEKYYQVPVSPILHSKTKTEL
ncbi:esterase FE4 isoform X2 [Bombyx mori]